MRDQLTKSNAIICLFSVFTIIAKLFAQTQHASPYHLEDLIQFHEQNLKDICTDPTLESAMKAKYETYIRDNELQATKLVRKTYLKDSKARLDHSISLFAYQHSQHLRRHLAPFLSFKKGYRNSFDELPSCHVVEQNSPKDYHSWLTEFHKSRVIQYEALKYKKVWWSEYFKSLLMATVKTQFIERIALNWNHRDVWPGQKPPRFKIPPFFEKYENGKTRYSSANEYLLEVYAKYPILRRPADMTLGFSSSTLSAKIFQLAFKDQIDETMSQVRRINKFLGPQKKVEIFLARLFKPYIQNYKSILSSNDSILEEALAEIGNSSSYPYNVSNDQLLTILAWQLFAKYSLDQLAEDLANLALKKALYNKEIIQSIGHTAESWDAELQQVETYICNGKKEFLEYSYSLFYLHQAQLKHEALPFWDVACHTNYGQTMRRKLEEAVDLTSGLAVLGSILSKNIGFKRIALPVAGLATAISFVSKAHRGHVSRFFELSMGYLDISSANWWQAANILNLAMVPVTGFAIAKVDGEFKKVFSMMDNKHQFSGWSLLLPRFHRVYDRNFFLITYTNSTINAFVEFNRKGMKPFKNPIFYADRLGSYIGTLNLATYFNSGMQQLLRNAVRMNIISFLVDYYVRKASYLMINSKHHPRNVEYTLIWSFSVGLPEKMFQKWMKFAVQSLLGKTLSTTPDNIEFLTALVSVGYRVVMNKPKTRMYAIFIADRETSFVESIFMKERMELPKVYLEKVEKLRSLLGLHLFEDESQIQKIMHSAKLMQTELSETIKKDAQPACYFCPQQPKRSMRRLPSN